MASKEVARRVLDSRSVVNFCPASNTTLNTLALTQWQVGNVLSQVVRNVNKCPVNKSGVPPGASFLHMASLFCFRLIQGSTTFPLFFSVSHPPTERNLEVQS